jgi:hypothetical protein
MFNKIGKQWIVLCVVVLALLCASKSYAADDTDWLSKGVNYSQTQTLYVSPKDDARYNSYSQVLFPLSKNIAASAITNLKSSDKKVLTVGKAYNEKSGKKKAVLIDLTLKKAGTATVSFKYKSKTYKIKYVVKKFSNGLSSVKLGGFSADYASKFNSSVLYELKAKKAPTNIVIKTKKNWVITDVEITSEKVSDWKSLFSREKGKTSVTLKDKAMTNDMDILVGCYNKKTGEEEYYYVEISPSKK